MNRKLHNTTMALIASSSLFVLGLLTASPTDPALAPAPGQVAAVSFDADHGGGADVAALVAVAAAQEHGGGGGSEEARQTGGLATGTRVFHATGGLADGRPRASQPARETAQRFCGNPRSTPRWRGSGQRLVTTLARV